MTFGNIGQFLGDLSSGCRDSIAALNNGQRDDIYGHVGKMIINIIEGIITCEPMRNRENNGIAVYEDPVPVLPQTIFLLTNREFCDFLNQQRPRLVTNLTALEINAIELEHGQLCDMLKSDAKLLDDLNNLGEGVLSTVGFKEAWSTGNLSSRFH